MARFALATLFIVSVVGCTLADALPTRTAQPSPSADVASIQRPAVSPTYEPGPASASGTVIRTEADSVVIRSAEGELRVDLLGVRSIWKETQVAPSDLEVGDELTVNGRRSGSEFDALYIWAGIGRFDGVVRALVGSRLQLLALPPSTRAFEVELSPYLEIIHTDGTSATIADITPGTTVGGVVYRPMHAMPRATKVWLSN